LKQSGDGEIFDENFYDIHKMSEVMKVLYEYMCDDTIFKELYELAVAKIISMDGKISQLILYTV
jgi:hypothetical protein